MRRLRHRRTAGKTSSGLLLEGAPILEPIRSDVPEQDEDDDDDEDEAERAAGHVAPAAAVRPARNGAQQQEDHDDEQDQAERGHFFLRLSVQPSYPPSAPSVVAQTRIRV